MGVAAERIKLRPFRWWDRAAYVRLRENNQLWLDRWEARGPGEDVVMPYGAVFQSIRSQHRTRMAASFAITVDGRIVGHLNFAPILWGATMQASAGYWVAEEWAGQGIAPVALARGIEEMIHTWGMHRIEVLVQPDNAASLAVVRKLDLRDEGIRHGAMHVDGRWRDHRVFAVLAEDVADLGAIERRVRAM